MQDHISKRLLERSSRCLITNIHFHILVGTHKPTQEHIQVRLIKHLLDLINKYLRERTQYHIQGHTLLDIQHPTRVSMLRIIQPPTLVVMLVATRTYLQVSLQERIRERLPTFLQPYIPVYSQVRTREYLQG